MKTEILLHNIEYSWKDGNENRQLTESDEEHIEKSIKEGYREGELCQFDEENQCEVFGWWKIAN